MKKLILLSSFFLSLSLGENAFSQTWLPALGQGVDDAALAFTEAVIEYQGEIVIAGEFASVSGVSVAYVAKWNGTTWQAMGTGLPAVARCLAIYNGELYAGLDNIGASTLYKWTGTTWVASGPFQDPILTLYVDPVSNTFYAGGYFTSPGKYVAKLNGTTWTGLGSLPAGSSSFPGVMAISVFNNELYVGGTFGGGTSTSYIAKLNASNAFVGLSNNQPNNPVKSFAQQDGFLYLGGAFSKIGPTNNRCVAKWDGSAWGQMAADLSGPNTAGGGVTSIASYKGQIYATGTFPVISITGLTATNIARWNDCQWLNLNDGTTPDGINGAGHCLAVIGNDLYMGGEFTQAGNVVGSKRIAGWNNNTECPDPACFPLNPTINITTSQVTTCTGSTVVCNSTITNGGTSPTYQWKVNGVNAGTNSATFSFTATTGTQTITCDVTSNDPCMITPTSTSNTLTVNVVTQITPTIAITANPTSVCSGNSITFTATISGGGSTPSYQWKVDGTNAGTNAATYSATLNNAQIVTCDLTSSESCAVPTSVTSNSITTNVTQTPTANVSISGNTMSVDQAGATYQWLICATGQTAVPGATSQTFSPSANGSYAVQVTNGVCVTTSNCTTFNFAGIDENITSANFKTFPNPSEGIFNIETTFENGFSIQLTDIFGKIILEKRTQNSDVIIDIKNEASGIYFITLFVDSQTYHQRIVKK